ncbi:MAG: hypothetical protein FDZ75_04155, partial [Actinobacteria bacterium]
MARWREYASAREDAARVDALSLQLAEDTSRLEAAGLSGDEALLVALRRIAEEDDATRRFIAENAAGFLAAPAATGHAPDDVAEGSKREFAVALLCAVAAAIAVKLPLLFGYRLEGDGAEFYLLNLSLLVLPFLAAYLAWAKRPPRWQMGAVAGVFVAGAVAVNAYPFVDGGSTQTLTAIHLPVLLWLTLGVVAGAALWRTVAARMEFTRFTGEWFITYALIAMGGGVLSGITVGVFDAIGLSTETVVSEWVIPCGAAGAVVIAAWLVEGRRNLVGGVAPMRAVVHLRRVRRGG